MNIEIRKAKLKEAKEIVDINVKEWRSTYSTILPEEIIKNVESNIEERVTKFENYIKNDNNIFVALVDDKIVGYDSYGKARNEDKTNCGEIYACYILDEYHGLGIGRMLVVKAMEELLKEGFTTLVTGCLDGNPANEFHKSIGGVYITTSDFKIKDYKAKENIYFHEDLAKSLEMNKQKLNKRR